MAALLPSLILTRSQRVSAISSLGKYGPGTAELPVYGAANISSLDLGYRRILFGEEFHVLLILR